MAPFRDATGHHLPLLCLQNCTSALNEVARGYGMPHEELARLAADEPPGCGGLTFLPYVSGERTPNWPHATGALLGVSPGLLRPGAVYRAALEGVTFALLAGYDRMRELGVDAKELRLVGGGSSNKLWRQIIADAFQLPLRFPAEPESAALGAALQAAAAFASTASAHNESAATQTASEDGTAFVPNGGMLTKLFHLFTIWPFIQIFQPLHAFL